MENENIQFAEKLLEAAGKLKPWYFIQNYTFFL